MMDPIGIIFTSLIQPMRSGAPLDRWHLLGLAMQLTLYPMKNFQNFVYEY